MRDLIFNLLPPLRRLRAQRDALARERNELLQENRDLKTSLAQTGVSRGATDLDQDFFDDFDAFSPKIVRHTKIWDYLESVADDPHCRVLEIGSRSVVSNAKWKDHFPRAGYTGFDVLPGINVDVVGDAHRLSDYFTREFDVIFSMAVFEHLAMPWVVAEEISKLLKPGGLLLIETHFSYSMHERPWHFFQFSDQGLKALFNRRLGFECLDVGVSNPIVGRFAQQADDYLRGKPVRNLFCHAAILCRRLPLEPDARFDNPWRQALEGVYDGTSYPGDTSKFE